MDRNIRMRVVEFKLDLHFVLVDELGQVLTGEVYNTIEAALAAMASAERLRLAAPQGAPQVELGLEVSA